MGVWSYGVVLKGKIGGFCRETDILLCGWVDNICMRDYHVTFKIDNMVSGCTDFSWICHFKTTKIQVTLKGKTLALNGSHEWFVIIMGSLEMDNRVQQDTG